MAGLKLDDLMKNDALVAAAGVALTGIPGIPPRPVLEQYPKPLPPSPSPEKKL